MLLAFHSNTIMPSSLQNDLEVTARAGFKGLELQASKIDQYLSDHTLGELKDLLDRTGIHPATINSLDLPLAAEDFPAVRDRFRALCTIAQGIGCPVVIVIPTPSPGKVLDWPATVERHVGYLRDLSEVARASGTKLALEFLGFGWCSVRTVRGALEIVEKTARDNVGMVIDVAHTFTGGSLLEEIDKVDPALLYGVHLDDLEDGPKESHTDYTRVLPGQGVAPVGAVLSRIRKTGYDGVCSVELFNKAFWEMDPFEVAVKCRAAATAVLAPHFTLR